MRVAVLSDIHGNSDGLRAVLEDFKGAPDKILFLGDLCGYYPFVPECLDLLKGWDLVAVRGNHDQALLDCLSRDGRPDAAYTDRYGSALQRTLDRLTPAVEKFVKSQPTQRQLELEGVAVGMYHGAPWSPLAARVYPDFSEWGRFDSQPENLVLLGHTHHAFQRTLGTKTLLNPGSVGQPRDRRPGASYALVDLEDMTVSHRRVPYDASRIMADAKEHDPGLPYLWEVLVRT